MRCYIYVFRHSQTYYNKRHIFTGGRIDSKLTPFGIKQAEKIAKKLKGKRIDYAFTSPLSRAKDTLKIVLKYHPECKKVFVDERLVERDYGELTRKSKDKYAREHPDLYPIYHRSYDVAPPGGESIKDVEKRVMPFIKDLIEFVKRNKVNVAISAHGNSLRPIRKYFEGLSNEEMCKIETVQDDYYEYYVEC